MTATTINTTPLTGDVLLAKLKEMVDASKTEKVRACGYVSLNEDGTERLNFTNFYENLMLAKGVKLASLEKSSEDSSEDSSEETSCEHLYNANVPIYVNVSIYRKKGLTSEEVLKSIDYDDCCDADADVIGELVEDSIRENNDVSVFDEDGERLNAFSN